MSEPVPIHKPPPPAAVRWGVLVFISLAMFGNYYVYGSIAPLADSRSVDAVRRGAIVRKGPRLVHLAAKNVSARCELGIEYGTWSCLRTVTRC